MAVKESSASKIKFKGVDALFGLSEEQECVREIPLDELDTFKNHPFKVFRDDKMEEMIESISEYGVLVPGIARPSNSGEKDYELVVGHRRKYAPLLIHNPFPQNLKVLQFLGKRIMN